MAYWNVDFCGWSEDDYFGHYWLEKKYWRALGCFTPSFSHVWLNLGMRHFSFVVVFVFLVLFGGFALVFCLVSHCLIPFSSHKSCGVFQVLVEGHWTYSGTYVLVLLVSLRLFNLDCRYPRDQLQPAKEKWHLDHANFTFALCHLVTGTNPITPRRCLYCWPSSLPLSCIPTSDYLFSLHLSLIWNSEIVICLLLLFNLFFRQFACQFASELHMQLPAHFADWRALRPRLYPSSFEQKKRTVSDSTGWIRAGSYLCWKATPDTVWTGSLRWWHRCYLALLDTGLQWLWFLYLVGGWLLWALLAGEEVLKGVRLSHPCFALPWGWDFSFLWWLVGVFVWWLVFVFCLGLLFWFCFCFRIVSFPSLHTKAVEFFRS